MESVLPVEAFDYFLVSDDPPVFAQFDSYSVAAPVYVAKPAVGGGNALN